MQLITNVPLQSRVETDTVITHSETHRCSLLGYHRCRPPAQLKSSPLSAMHLKRKRSESELSFSSAFSSPLRPESSSFDFGAIAMDMDIARRAESSVRAHLPSRTMKRFRNNRPSEDQVHRKFLQW